MNSLEHPTFRTGPRDAEAYDTMRHDPTNPYVLASYNALATAVVGQWNGLRAMGFHFLASTDDPYTCSRDALADISRNGVLKVYADGGQSLPHDHPMQASPVAFGADLNTALEGFVTMNDVFRGVHDVMGHYAAHRAGLVATFGPVGEYNAWVEHFKTMPAAAYLALWCETRGQNAWTNFHADHAEIPLADRPYVDQRAGIPSLPGITTAAITRPMDR